MQDKGLLLRSYSIVNSHGDQVHVNENFVMWFNTIFLKQFIAPFCFKAVPLLRATSNFISSSACAHSTSDYSVLSDRTLRVANVSSWWRIFLVYSSVCMLGTFMLLTLEAELTNGRCLRSFGKRTSLYFHFLFLLSHVIYNKQTKT